MLDGAEMLRFALQLLSLYDRKASMKRDANPCTQAIYSIRPMTQISQVIM